MRLAYLTYLLGFILIASSASAAFYTDFRSPKAICGDDGTLTLVTQHSGRVIEPSEIIIRAEDEYGQKIDVKGRWYVRSDEVSYIRGSTPIAFTEVTYVADTKFPKNENYKVFFSYKRTSEAYDYTTLSVVANCPGIVCTSNAQCALTDRCENGRCTNLRCNVCQKPHLNACIAKCDDGNACTNDICRDGVCNHEPIPNCCVGNSDCDDGLVCTDDVCSDGFCRNLPVQCIGTDVCVTGACLEGKGCVYENNLTCLNEENRRYVLQVGEPRVTHTETRPTTVWSWIATVLKNFFG